MGASKHKLIMRSAKVLFYEKKQKDPFNHIVYYIHYGYIGLQIYNFG